MSRFFLNFGYPFVLGCSRNQQLMHCFTQVKGLRQMSISEFKISYCD